jgi:hypothetical protein
MTPRRMDKAVALKDINRMTPPNQTKISNPE